MNIEQQIVLEQIHTAIEDIDVAFELTKYIPIAINAARAMKAERKLNNDLSEEGLKTLVKMFDMDHHAGTEYALKMTLRSFNSENIT